MDIDFDIQLEIHSPGLNLHSSRWNLHTLFLQEIESIYERVAAEGWKQYREKGRGTLTVDQEQWMDVLRGGWHEEAFPCSYLTGESSVNTMDFGVLRRGFRQLIDDYNPSREVVLAVHHHPGDMVSCYLFESDPTPEECYARLSAGGKRQKKPRP